MSRRYYQPTAEERSYWISIIGTKTMVDIIYYAARRGTTAVAVLEQERKRGYDLKQEADRIKFRSALENLIKMSQCERIK